MTSLTEIMAGLLDEPPTYEGRPVNLDVLDDIVIEGMVTAYDESLGIFYKRLAVEEINHPSLLTSIPPFIPPETLGYAIGRCIGRSISLPLVYGTTRIGGRIRWFAGDGG